MSAKPKKTKKKAEKVEEKKEEAPPAEAPAAEAPAEEKKEEAPPPKKAASRPSNVFALFSQSQIQEFKEAFQLMDLNRDGFLDASDIAGIWAQTGREAEPKTVDAMIEESPGKLNFTNFLALFGEKMHGTDPEKVLFDAWQTFDSEKCGKLDEKYIKHLLTSTKGKFSPEEIKMTWKEAPIEGGKLDYALFTQYIKRGKEEDQA